MQQQTQVHLFYTQNICARDMWCACVCVIVCTTCQDSPEWKKSQGAVWTQPLWPQSVLPSDLAAWEGWSQSSRPHSCWRRWIAVRSLGAIADLGSNFCQGWSMLELQYTHKRSGKPKTHPTFPSDVRISLGCHYDGAGLPNEGHTIEYRISASKPLNISRIAEKIHVQATLKVLLWSSCWIFHPVYCSSTAPTGLGQFVWMSTLLVEFQMFSPSGRCLLPQSPAKCKGHGLCLQEEELLAAIWQKPLNHGSKHDCQISIGLMSSDVRECCSFPFYLSSYMFSKCKDECSLRMTS